MPTANNLIRFSAFPVYNSTAKQYRMRKGVDYSDNCTFVAPTFSFALPSFMIKIPATSKPLTKFRSHYPDGTNYIDFEIDNLTRVTYNDSGTMYDIIAYYGDVLLDSSKDIIEMACGTYYASIRLDDEVYYTELFRVYDNYATSEENIIANGNFEFDLSGWQYNGADVYFTPGQVIIKGTTDVAPLRQDLSPEAAPFQYLLTLDIELDPSVELRVRFTDGTNITRTIVYPATGVYTEIINNPVQIRFETSAFSGGESAYINSVSLKKITTLDCFNRLVWGNDCTLNGLPYYIQVNGIVKLFSQTAMFTALVSSPKFNHTIDESENEKGEKTKNFESVERRITVAASPVPQFLVDALQLLPLHTNATFIDINNAENTPDFTEADEPESVVENIYFTQTMELVDVSISEANCCTTVAVASCPEDIPKISVDSIYDEEDLRWIATINPLSPISGYENALFQLVYTDVNIFADCPASPPTGYIDGGTFTQDQINNGEVVMSIVPDGRRWCFRFMISLPQCSSIDGQFTDPDSFNANIPL